MIAILSCNFLKLTICQIYFSRSRKKSGLILSPQKAAVKATATIRSRSPRKMSQLFRSFLVVLLVSTVVSLYQALFSLRRLDNE